MFWRLTLIGVLISLRPGLTLAQSSRPATNSRPAPNALHSVHWEKLPLGMAVRRLNAISRTTVVLDRRVDPNQRIDLVLNSADANEIAAQLAAANSLGHARFERLFYIGPPQTANRLSALAALRRQEIASLPADLRRTLVDRRRIVWPRLTEPRGLITRLIEDHGWRAEHAERMPHDLWAAGELPSFALADQLTVLLAGFDLTYRIVPDRRAIEIVPIDWNTIEESTPQRTSIQRPQRPLQPPLTGKQVFTLRIENQPVGKVLDQLGQRLGWQIAVDEAALRAAGRSLDQRVSFTVEYADEDDLLNALLTPAGLKAERDGDSVRIKPR